MTVWEHLAEHTSQRLEEHVMEGKKSAQNLQRYYKPVTSKELLQIFGLLYVFRGRKNNVSYKKQFDDHPPYWKEWPTNKKRLCTIISNLSCDWRVFTNLLRLAWKRAVIVGDDVTVDESLFKFYAQGAQKEDSPQRYIPRKPHPNGMFSILQLLVMK